MRSSSQLLSSGSKCLSIAFGACLLLGVIGFSFVMSHFSRNSRDTVRLISNTSAVESQFEYLRSEWSSPGNEDVRGYLSLDEVQHMVATTNGFFVRDYSLGLGWNNMRYIIESAALQARILNRTLIIPSFVYARACVYDDSVCAAEFETVDRRDIIQAGHGRFNYIATSQKTAFRVPISAMLNLTLLRQTQPVVLMSQYLQLHGLSLDREHLNGVWYKNTYNTEPNIYNGRVPTLFELENRWYDPSDTIRVDILRSEVKERGKWWLSEGSEETGPIGYWGAEEPTNEVAASLQSAARVRNRFWLDWAEARSAIRDGTASGLWDDAAADSDDRLVDLVQASGWEVVYTYQRVRDHEFSKNVATPIKQLVPRSSLRGLHDEYGDVDADVLKVSGEIHVDRKPGSIRFTTPTARNAFTSMVLDCVHPRDAVYGLAQILDERMRELTNGRAWMAAHIRRGDFVRIGWSSVSLDKHLEQVKIHMSGGRKLLDDLARGGTQQPYDTPNSTFDSRQIGIEPPLEDDPFFIATDERDPNSKKLMASQGAIFLSDLLKKEDRKSFGLELMLVDVQAVVEQALLARAGFVYAHGMSSLAGGVVNMRAKAGKDARTIDLI